MYLFLGCFYEFYMKIKFSKNYPEKFMWKRLKNLYFLNYQQIILFLDRKCFYFVSLAKLIYEMENQIIIEMNWRILSTWVIKKVLAQ